MTDFHIHIGQFNEVYYDALEVFGVIEKRGKQFGINEICYSSTSSCRDDAELPLVEEEIAYAQSFSSDTLLVKPYLWFIPKYADQKISVSTAMQAFDYMGIKLHPIAQNWDFTNSCHAKSLHEIFRYADENQKIVLIHCGTQECDLPNRFEKFFAEYTNAKIIIAHSNPINETAEMVNKYKNVFCDVAATEFNSIRMLRQKLFDKSKILFGSDFPITNYFNTRLFDKNRTLSEEYFENCKAIRIMTDRL